MPRYPETKIRLTPKENYNLFLLAQKYQCSKSAVIRNLINERMQFELEEIKKIKAVEV
jgi:hypothetical protein